MRGAPPVHMACGRDARWASALTLLSAAAAATLVWWLVRHAGGSTAHGAAAALAGGASAAGLLLRACRRASQRRLQWDGRAWLLDGMPGRVEVMIDLERWMLVRFEAQSHEPGPRVKRLHWLPIDLGRAGSSPHLCRAALHAHAGGPEQSGPAGSGA